MTSAAEVPRVVVDPHPRYVSFVWRFLRLRPHIQHNLRQEFLREGPGKLSAGDLSRAFLN